MEDIGGKWNKYEKCRKVKEKEWISGICVWIESFVDDSSKKKCIRKVGNGE